MPRVKNASSDNPDPLDVDLGIKIRVRRKSLGLSMSALGDAVGLTFQQVQKYERGLNRVSFSKLAMISKALSCRVADLIADLEQAESKPAVGARNGLLEITGATELLELYAKVTTALAVVADEVEAMAEHPVLRMTPADHQRAIGHAGAEIVRGAVQGLERATQAADSARRELAGIIGVVRTQDAQNKMVALAAGAALVAGLILSPAFASVLPFGLNQQVAAAVMRSDRWSAGAALKAADKTPGHATT